MIERIQRQGRQCLSASNEPSTSRTKQETQQLQARAKQESCKSHARAKKETQQRQARVKQEPRVTSQTQKKPTSNGRRCIIYQKPSSKGRRCIIYQKPTSKGRRCIIYQKSPLPREEGTLFIFLLTSLGNLSVEVATVSLSTPTRGE